MTLRSPFRSPLSPDFVVADQIEVRGIRAIGVIGGLSEEKERGQPFEVDLVVEADLAGPVPPTHSIRPSTTASPPIGRLP